MIVHIAIWGVIFYGATMAAYFFLSKLSFFKKLAANHKNLFWYLFALIFSLTLITNLILSIATAYGKYG